MAPFTVADVYAAATQLGYDPLEIFAYSAVHGRIPSGADMPAFESQAHSADQASGSLGVQFVYAYAQANRGLPGGLWGSSYQTWLMANGYMNTSAQMTGLQPIPGLGWQQATGATTGGAPPTPPAQASGGSGDVVEWISQHPLVAGGAALITVGIVAGMGRRR